MAPPSADSALSASSSTWSSNGSSPHYPSDPEAGGQWWPICCRTLHERRGWCRPRPQRRADALHWGWAGCTTWAGRTSPTDPLCIGLSRTSFEHRSAQQDEWGLCPPPHSTDPLFSQICWVAFQIKKTQKKKNRKKRYKKNTCWLLPSRGKRD